MPDPLIIWKNTEDGTLRVTHVVDKNIDLQKHIDTLSETHPELEYRFTTDTDEFLIPFDYFWPALTIDENNQLAYDMVKLRARWREGLRARRAPLLQQLDIDYQRADEVGDTALKAEIVAKKNILRDCTDDPAIDAAKDINDLRRSIPELLAD